MDLALEISKNANRVILSHHLTETILTVFPENVVQVKASKRELGRKIIKSNKDREDASLTTALSLFRKLMS